MKPTRPDSKVRRNLSKRWYNMQARCNNPDHPRYSDYGGVGVKVDERWNDKETFLEDAKTLQGFNEEMLLEGKLHLDKDFLHPSNKIYSRDTCVFVSLEDNNRLKPSQMQAFIATSPNGKELEGLNQSEFAREHGLKQSTISSCLKGDIKKHRGWSFRLKE